MRRTAVTWKSWLGTGLLLGAAGCVGAGGDGHPAGAKPGENPRSTADLKSSKTALARADDCPDLLTKIQEDAIAKLDLVVAQQRELLEEYDPHANPPSIPGGGGVTGIAGGGGVAGGFGGEDLGVGRPVNALPPVASSGPASVGGLSGGTLGGVAGGTSSGGGTAAGGGGEANAGTAAGGTGSSAPTTTTPTPQAPSDGHDGKTDESEPIGASDTNNQVEGVEEADFVKLVDNGKAMYLLHGNSLRKLKTFPAEELSLDDAELKIEGSPSELFVTDAGRAVVFSSVYGYGHPPSGIAVAPGYCTPSWCGGGDSYTKITLADVSGDAPRALREIYYRGNYISSRRHGDVVRTVLQSYNTYSNLYSPSIQWTDAWGRYYERDEIEEQLAQWRERTAGSIRDTTLGDWLPVVQQVEDGKLVDVEPSCGSYFVPQPGISDYGLTHVLSLDVSVDRAPIGGITVLGQASTVYASLDRLVLAQPDYRWLDGSSFGFMDEQRTSLHMFGLMGDDTKYLASGWVQGHLPQYNPQFGLDVSDDHTLRVATTGSVRSHPEATPNSPDFWATSVENRVYTLRQHDAELSVVGRSENLGHTDVGETLQSARFVGDRGYLVTYRQKDPLLVLDLADAASPRLIGEIAIPGFSMYMHPLDAAHLITFGQSDSGGSQLQLFDVTDPVQLPAPKVLDLGMSWSELSNNHKAFTFYAEQNLIALPLSGNYYDPTQGYRPSAGLKVISVDTQRGFELLGSIDHSELYQAQQCVICDSLKGCYSSCWAPVEMRRGHFVESADATYVYAISYGGVSVSDVDDLSKTIKTVVLPQASYDPSSWYLGAGSGGSTTAGGGFVGGGFVGGGFAGGGSTGTGIATPGTIAVPPAPPAEAVDGGTIAVPHNTEPADAGVSIPAQDGGAGTKL